MVKFTYLPSLTGPLHLSDPSFVFWAFVNVSLSDKYK